MYARWTLDFYKEMTTPNDVEIIESGWRASGMKDTIKFDSKGLPPIDSSESIEQLINDNEAANQANQLQAICSLTAKEHSFGYSRHEESKNDDGNSN